jgi:hypothetical protein
MDTKKRSLSREKVVYGVAEVLLLTSILATLYFLVMIKPAGDLVEYRLAAEGRDKIWSGMSDQYWHRADDIALFPPPSDETALSVWADSIRSRMGFPVAIFLRQDTTIRPVSVPEHLRPYMSDLPRLFNPDARRTERLNKRTPSEA